MVNVAVNINGQDIPWSAVQKVRRMCGGDWDQTIDAFWKARNAFGANAIMRYVMKGFVPINGVRYSLLPSKEREGGQMENIRQWWRDMVGTNAPGKRGPVRARMALKEALMEIAGGL